MPMTGRADWIGVRELHERLALPEARLCDAQAAAVLGHINRNLQSILISNIDIMRHFIAGVLVEAALHDPPEKVWVYKLQQELPRHGRPIKLTTLKAHLDAMRDQGYILCRLENRRTMLEATPQLVERVRRFAEFKAVLMRDTLDRTERLKGSSGEILPGGPLAVMRGGPSLEEPLPADPMPIAA